MLYHLFEYLNESGIPGAGVFRYITFRAAMAVIFSLLISLFFGKSLIKLLHRKQVGESVRDLGILIPTLLFARLDNVYIQTLLLATVWLGIIGFLDDYIKVFKKNKEGLAGRFKIIGQVGVGLLVGTMLYFNNDVTIKQKVQVSETHLMGRTIPQYEWQESRELKTTIPFVKNNEFDYSSLLWFLGKDAKKYAWIVFIPIVIFIVTAVSNGANMTDGLDGLATGTSAIIGVTLAILAFLSGNYVFADYLNIMYIPQSGEMVIFISAFIGAAIGFLWYNAFPAQVFMGDTGSLALGGIIAVFAIAIRKELLIPIFCGIFLAENISVMVQVFWFKYTRFNTSYGNCSNSSNCVNVLYR